MRSIVVALTFLLTSFPAFGAECPPDHKVAVVEAQAVSQGASTIRWFKDGAEYAAFHAVLKQNGFPFQATTNRMGAAFYLDTTYIVEAEDDCFLQGTPIPTAVFRELLVLFERMAVESAPKT